MYQAYEPGARLVFDRAEGRSRLRGREDGFMKRLAVAIIGAFFLSACASGGGGPTPPRGPHAGGTPKNYPRPDPGPPSPLTSFPSGARPGPYQIVLFTLHPHP